MVPLHSAAEMGCYQILKYLVRTTIVCDGNGDGDGDGDVCNLINHTDNLKVGVMCILLIILSCSATFSGI